MGAIYAGYLPLVQRIVRRRITTGVGAQSSEDATQEVFAALFQRFIIDKEPLKPNQCIGTWLVRVAMNKSADTLRTELHRRPQEYMDAPAFHNTLKEKPDVDVDVVEATMARLRQARVHEAIKALPERQREVVWRRSIQDATSKETAEELGISDGNVRLTLHRALLAMKKYLQAPGDREAELRERPELRHNLDLDRLIPHPKGPFTQEELKEFVGYQRETALRRSQIRPPRGDYTPEELREYMGHQYATILRHERDSYWP